MNSRQPLRILIADDHQIVRDGLAALLHRSGDMLVVAEAANGEEAVERFTETRPDVTLLDLRMPGMDGVEAITRILEFSPRANIIMLTTYDGDQYIYRALHAGAKAYLLKDVDRSELINTIRTVAQGQSYVPPAIAAKLASRLQRPELTGRELEVLTLIAAGHSNQEVAGRLFIAEGTVKAHLNNIFSKMAVNDRTSAVLQGLERGLLELG